MGDWQQTTQRHGAQIIGGRSETRTGRAGVNSGWLQGGDETAIGSPSSFGSIELYKVSDFRGMGTFSHIDESGANRGLETIEENGSSDESV